MVVELRRRDRSYGECRGLALGSGNARTGDDDFFQADARIGVTDVLRVNRQGGHHQGLGRRHPRTNPMAAHGSPSRLPTCRVRYYGATTRVVELKREATPPTTSVVSVSSPPAKEAV